MKNESNLISFIVGTLLGGVFLFAFLLVTRAAWPLVRITVKLIFKAVAFVALAAFSKLKSRSSASAAPAPSGLPTPDVFKGYPNLAKAKQLNIR
jgi:hypothetical protein